MDTVQSFLGYFFTSIPGKEFAYYKAFYLFIAILFVSAIIFSQNYKKKKKTDVAFKRCFKNVSNRLITFAIIFGILMLLRYEQIPYLSTRILLYLTSLIFLYWLYKTVKTYKVTYLKAKGHQEEKKHSLKEKKEVKTYSASKKRK